MAIKIGQEFERTSKATRFKDDVMTKAQMLAGTDDNYSDGYLVVEKDSHDLYIYDSNATPSAETGKFVKSSSSGGGGASLTIDTTDPNYGDATISEGIYNLSFTNQNGDGVLISGISENGETVASKSYVDANAGKIDKIKINDVEQTITNKEVNIPTAVNYDYDNHILTVETGGSNGYRVKATKKDKYYEISNTNLDSGYEGIESIPFTSYVDDELAKKQNKLVSGTNIKTINNQSILEPGDLEITGVNEEFEFIDIDLKDFVDNGDGTYTRRGVEFRTWDECTQKIKNRTLIVRIKNTGVSEAQQPNYIYNLKYIRTAAVNKLVFGGADIDEVNITYCTFYVKVPSSGNSCNMFFYLYKQPKSGGGGSLPAGGTTGQALVKKSDTDGDVEWKTVGGESTIDVIKVNGITQTITNKEVDLTVATMSAQGSQLNVNGAGIQVYDDDDYLKIIKSDNGIRLDAFHTNSNKQPTSGITNLTIPDKAYVDSNAATITKIKVNGTEQTITNKEVDLAVPNVTAGDHSITVNVPDNSKGFWLEQKAGGVEFGGTHADGDFGTVILTDKTYVDNKSPTIVNEGATFLNASGNQKMQIRTGGADSVIIKDTNGDGTTEYWSHEVPNKTYVDNAVSTAISTANNTFLIIKDTTTYQEILNAFNAKKGLLFCNSAVVDGTSYPAVYALKQTDHILLYVHNHPQIIDVWKVNTDDTYEKTREFVLAENQAIKDYVDGKVGNLTNLTTDNKDNLVNAINEVYEKSGEPFRVKNWASSSLNVTIEPCTTDKSNGELAKMVFSIDAVEGADYQIVGMISYEIFDNTSGGNRLNVWPVCQFTGNGQKELSVRWVCAGSTAKTAKRINAWVLLKHR